MRRDASPGLAGSLSQLLQRSFLQLSFGKQPLQSGILFLDLFQTLCAIGLHAAVLVTPPVVGLLSDAEFTAGIGDGAALAEDPVSLPELPNDLLRGITLSLIVYCMICSPQKRGVLDSRNEWTYKTGLAQN